MGIPSRSDFEAMYANQAPWDIGRPQSALLQVADEIRGRVLDAGCGTGDTALYFAERNCQVTGFDFLDEPIRRARHKAVQRGAHATFRVADALSIGQWADQFDAAIDSGLFHVFNPVDRRRYVDQLAQVLRPAARLYLLCFSDWEPGEQGPQRLTRDELLASFTNGWQVERIERTHFEVRTDMDVSPTEGGPHGWFVVVRRLEAKDTAHDA